MTSFRWSVAHLIYTSYHRLMSDFDVNLVNDSMSEFYVKFKGPTESKCFCLLPFAVLENSAHVPVGIDTIVPLHLYFFTSILLCLSPSYLSATSTLLRIPISHALGRHV